MMDNDIRKGQICGLITTGLHLEGLLRVALERTSDTPGLDAQLRETFRRYTAVFNNLFPEAEEQPASVAVEAREEIVVETKSPAEEKPEESPAEKPEEEIEETSEENTEEIVDVKEVKADVHERPLSEALKVDELIARKESADLRKAFTLNDKFRFRRTIFGGSDQQFVSTLGELEKLSRYEDALTLLAEVLPPDGEDNEDFLNIIKQHFDSKQ